MSDHTVAFEAGTVKETAMLADSIDDFSDGFVELYRRHAIAGDDGGAGNFGQRLREAAIEMREADEVGARVMVTVVVPDGDDEGGERQ